MIVLTRPKPAPTIVGLAWDGIRLWAGDWKEQALLELNDEQAVAARHPAPGKPIGLMYGAGRLLAVLADPSTDDRSIHWFDPHAQAWTERTLRCPDDTGSHVFWDGHKLWLSQRYNKRVFEFRDDGSIGETISIPWEITGFFWIDTDLWLSVRVEKGFTDVARLRPGMQTPELIERYQGSFATLAYDGSGFWMSELRGETIVKVSPAALISAAA